MTDHIHKPTDKLAAQYPQQPDKSKVAVLLTKDEVDALHAHLQRASAETYRFDGSRPAPHNLVDKVEPHPLATCAIKIRLTKQWADEFLK